MENLTPIKAIREKCLDCCCGQEDEVTLCPKEDCALYQYRFGKNPNRKGIGNKSGYKNSTFTKNT